jgi:hypothetical protein
MAGSKYHAGLPEPTLAHEMWSREVCDRLDEVIRLLKAQNETLVGDRAKSVQVEITEPDSSGSQAKVEDKSPAKAEEKAPVKPAPARAASTAKAPAARK